MRNFVRTDEQRAQAQRGYQVSTGGLLRMPDGGFPTWYSRPPKWGCGYHVRYSIIGQGREDTMRSSSACERKRGPVPSFSVHPTQRVIDLSRIQQIALATALLSSCLGSASAQNFQGRLADGTPSATCTVSGGTKCAMFFNPTLNITILNNWNIGTGDWSATAAAGSAQALAASAGLSASGLTGWVLPTNDWFEAAGPLRQYRSIWNEVGSSFAGLSGQFEGVQSSRYWSVTEFAPNPTQVWWFRPGDGADGFTSKDNLFYAVAVRPGDVAAAVPEPQTYAMLLAGLGAMVVVVRRRRPAVTAG